VDAYRASKLDISRPNFPLTRSLDGSLLGYGVSVTPRDGGTDLHAGANGPQGIGTAQLTMPALALCFGFILVLVSGVFYFAAELSGQHTGWALLLCHQAPSLCINSQPFLYAAGVMFLAYLILDRLNR
jgi:hypothetical protein